MIPREMTEVSGDLIDPEDIPLGEVVWVARRLEVSFDGRLDQTQTIPLATGISTDAWITAALFCVLHAKNTWPGPRVRLLVAADACSLTRDEPDTVFVESTLAAVEINEITPIQSFHVAAFSSGAPMARVVVAWEQASNEASAPQTAVISVGIVVRRRVAPDIEVFPEPAS